ncbi:MAG: hypothetical protein ACI4V2_00980 [Alloprevotella sp.]
MIRVYVMSTCPDCHNVKAQLACNPVYEIIDIGEHVRHLKAFLRLRDTHPAFADVKAKGQIGIPCFVFADETVSFELPEGLEPSAGASCSLDGKGC